MMSSSLTSSSLSGTRVQQQHQQVSARTGRLAVRCQAVQETDSRRKILGLGALLAFTAARPAFAEDLAKPSNTGGEKVKAPKSAPTSEADAPKPTPTADIKEGGELIAKLTAQSEKNKALNDKKRLATSYANFENSRTIADGTCTFPKNLFGCGNRAVAGKVKYISDDQDLECQGKPDGKCGSRIQTNSIPKAFKN